MEQVQRVKVKITPDGRINRGDAAALLGMAPKTLAEWKRKGWGPRMIRVGGRVFYDYEECLKYARGEKSVVPEAA